VCVCVCVSELHICSPEQVLCEHADK
jgi:hypothetical protein